MCVGTSQKEERPHKERTRDALTVRRSAEKSAMPITSSARAIAPRAQLGESLGMQDMGRARPLEDHLVKVPHKDSFLALLSSVRTSSHVRAVAPALTALSPLMHGVVLLTGRCHARAAC